MNHLIRLKTTAPSLLMTLTLLYLGFLPTAHAVVPAPDGGYGPPAYGAGNTAEGQSALLSLTSGGFNTAFCWLSLRSNTTGTANTAIGAGTLLANMAGGNTAPGASGHLR